MNARRRGERSVARVNGELVQRVYDSEFVRGGEPSTVTVLRRVIDGTGRVLRTAWGSERVARLRAVAGYRVRKAPRDVGRLVWCAVRGHGRWVAKGWCWVTHGDLRADARAARLSGDPEARRTAQEAIRTDARARWAKVGIGLRRGVITAAAMVSILVLLALLELVVERCAMPGWLGALYAVRDGAATVFGVLGRWLPIVGALGWLVAAVWEGRDRTPGAGWLTQPDRNDTDSWVDERMISRALAHLGIAPLNTFFKDGGELTYLTPARKDGDGTFARVRLPLGVTADMVADRRTTLAANLGRASLETWPTKADEDGVLDLWIADKGTLSGGAGEWPLVHDGAVDLFDGVPFGLTQRGVVINAPLLESNWLVGGRPGQGKTSALRTLLLGAALDPTAELWAFVMGESPDFDPLTPRLGRYRMGIDDTVVADTVGALHQLLDEMERRGRVLGAQSGRPPKVSRKLADKPGLGLHPLVVAIDECHELFQHHKYGKEAEELAVRLIKRGRKYGIILLLATQSPTKDSIPKEVTRNISCGVAFAVADHIANDGLLGAGRYRAGIRATELRTKTDRGTCVAVGVTDEPWELVRTFYIPLEDGSDMVSPVIARAVELLHERGLEVATSAEQHETPSVDHLADIAHVIGGEHRVRTQVLLARLGAHNPAEYDGWTLTDLATALAQHGIQPGKSHGVMVVRGEAIAAAHAAAHRPEEYGDDAVSPSASPSDVSAGHVGEARMGSERGKLPDSPEGPQPELLGELALSSQERAPAVEDRIAATEESGLEDGVSDQHGADGDEATSS